MNAETSSFISFGRCIARFHTIQRIRNIGFSGSGYAIYQIINIIFGTTEIEVPYSPIDRFGLSILVSIGTCFWV